MRTHAQHTNSLNMLILIVFLELASDKGPCPIPKIIDRTTILVVFWQVGGDERHCKNDQSLKILRSPWCLGGMAADEGPCPTHKIIESIISSTAFCEVGGDGGVRPNL